ncbi:bifunctional tetrahydrofolate synthase/dihydrofolate synthase [Legionella dresdenensis]|uniref:Dihydrofolate synthase/folylpolyglutamate synthase n=1 Tax=Legionella dresdenensis TaxID=450200 RepID=A0ABV8CBF7_9GAMM
MSKTLIQWLKELETRHSQEIQLGLERVAQVAGRLNLLNPEPWVIAVAGTNGKGSAVASLESIYMAAGYQIASYTSPHLVAFNERISINRQSISDAALIEAFEVIEQAREEVALTYFETTTLAALWYFKQQPLDVIILEVGLGGRLDATNIINSDLAIITTIDYDHQMFLGDTLEQIGREKAGIMRTSKPCVYADRNPPQSITEYANAIKAKLLINGGDYVFEVANDKLQLTFADKDYALPLPKYHPNSVTAAVVACILLQPGLPVSEQAFRDGIADIQLQGRMQIIEGHCTTLLDVAHNPQAAGNLAATVAKNYPDRKIHVVFSAFEDKDISGTIKPMVEIADCWYPALMASRRAANKEQLLCALEANGVWGTLCYNDPLLAYQAACQQAAPGDLIIVYGSFIMVGSVLSSLKGEKYETGNG